MEQPDWSGWTRQDAEGLRRVYPNSRLADREWVATIVAELKDEDFLMKRRGKGSSKS